jgi:O-antigen biosynthesis protein WbqP
MGKPENEQWISKRRNNFYNCFGKRMVDLILSSIGIVVFAIPMGIIAIIIKVSDPGSALFMQKRVGQHKKHFMLLKFRSMKMSTPHDIPTHQLKDPEQYLLKMGAFLRKYSLDELPQLFNIFRGDMSIIGPRPALWNQYDLIEEREKYGANDVKPGLSGLAQISGRDELEIPIKAKLDGEYVRRMSFRFDCRCIVGTVGKVLKHDGVVEGGTGKMGQKGEKEG